MYYLYILYSRKMDCYYIGSTGNVADRLRKHLSRHGGFTGKAKDWEVVYTENFSSKEEAVKREKQLKNWKNRSRIASLIKRGSVSKNA